MKVIFWRDRRLWSVTIRRGWKENSSASVCFFSIIKWPVSPPSRNPVWNYDKTDVWFTRAGPEKFFWPHSCAVLLHFPRKWFIKMTVNSRQRFPWIVNCSDPKKARSFWWSSILLLFLFKKERGRAGGANSNAFQFFANPKFEKKFSKFGGSFDTFDGRSISQVMATMVGVKAMWIPAALELFVSHQRKRVRWTRKKLFSSAFACANWTSDGPEYFTLLKFYPDMSCVT